MSKFIVEAYSQELNINKTYLWSGSKISLCWVKNPPSRKSCIVQRVNNIKAASSEAILCHVKGSENPADLLTRGINSYFFLK